MPWVDHDKLQQFRLMSYLQPFLIIVVPNVLFVSALFFAVGAITRNLLAIYVQGVALLRPSGDFAEHPARSRQTPTGRDPGSVRPLHARPGEPVLDRRRQEHTGHHAQRADAIESGPLDRPRGGRPRDRVRVRSSGSRGEAAHRLARCRRRAAPHSGFVLAAAGSGRHAGFGAAAPGRDSAFGRARPSQQMAGLTPVLFRLHRLRARFPGDRDHRYCPRISWAPGTSTVCTGRRSGR